jgi:predicted tellurium resistance membrane protein TerC
MRAGRLAYSRARYPLRPSPDAPVDWLSDPQAWIALLTLTVLEIVLGVDNIVFISILSGRLPEAERAKARTLGLALALFGRVALLLSLSWVLGLTEPLFAVLHGRSPGAT